MSFFNVLIYIILICVVLWFVRRFLSKFKVPQTGCLVTVDGGVKAGKSTLSCAIVRSKYKHNLRSTKIANFFRRICRKPEYRLPVIYSNVPLNCDYVPVTRSLLLRETKPIEGSVMYLQEASLVADSQLIKDPVLNNKLLMFFKLCGHQGLTVVVDSQTVSDLHYSEKRSTSQVFYVRNTIKWIPFFLLVNVIETVYSEDGSMVFAQNKDADELVKKVLLSKGIWKMFDSRAFSSLTDYLAYDNTPVVHGKNLSDLKVRELVSFRPEFNLKVPTLQTNQSKEVKEVQGKPR